MLERLEPKDEWFIYADRPYEFIYNLTKIDPPMRREGTAEVRLDEYAQG